MWEEYFSPGSVREALEILRSYGERAQIIAGGTDLVPEVKKHTREVKYLVDISGIEELQKIAADGDNIRIGAGATHSAVAASALIRDNFPALAKACGGLDSGQGLPAMII